MMWGQKARQGFTLIEVLIVIVILGILAMIIVPQVSVSTDDAKLSTLRTNLSTVRSALELYYVQHTNSYPYGSASNVIERLSRYTDLGGAISVSRSATYKYGPYLRGGLPVNPFNNKSDLTVDSTTADITARSSSGAGTGYKFYTRTGVFIAADGAHDGE